MSYHILPKNYNLINVNPNTSNHINNLYNSYISFSLINYYFNLKNEIIEMFNLIPPGFEDNKTYISRDNFHNIEEALQIVNPYEYVYNNIPGFKYPVSKFTEKTHLFYELLEIINTLDLLDNFNNSYIKTLHISKNTDSIKCLQLLRNNKNDTNYYFDNFENYEYKILDNKNSQTNNFFFNEYKYDFIYTETNINNYIPSLIQILLIILKQQKNSGNCIIKISTINSKPIIDIIYFLSSLYDTLYIVKPNTSNITSFDKYIICKNYLLNEKDIKYLKFNYYKLFVFIKKFNNEKISGLFDFDIPYYFKNKLDDLNIIIGQKQIEAMDLIINIYKNKNNNNKIELLKKNNIQKSINWCQLHKIPYYNSINFNM